MPLPHRIGTARIRSTPETIVVVWRRELEERQALGGQAGRWTLEG